MTLSPNALYLLEHRYCLKGEKPDDVLKRVSKFLGDGSTKLQRSIYNLMKSGTFLPNSPCLFNAGLEKGNLHACYILPIEDDIESILAALGDMVRIFKSGGGAGINFSPLRPEGSPLSGRGEASGPISFMEAFDKMVVIIKQGGVRRGALMGILNHYHPDIFEFMKVKQTGKLQNFNLSVLVTDDFMNALDKKENSNLQKNIFDVACLNAWSNGDPGLLFYDRINKDNPLFPKVQIDCCNPCSEVAMPPYSACCLGSINISKFVFEDDFDEDAFGETCCMAVEILSKMNEKSSYPSKKVQTKMKEYNPVGVGIMGFADALIMLGIKYDSKESLDFIDRIGEVYKTATQNTEKDIFHFYRRIIAPTGSLSILADCSSGIEPVFDAAFKRNLTVGVISETRELYKSKYTRTSHQVSAEWHVKVLAQWQTWVDGGVSKTVNLPREASVQDVRDVYRMAWELGCKGITVYRDQSRTDQVLTSTFKPNRCEGDSCTL